MSLYPQSPNCGGPLANVAQQPLSPQQVLANRRAELESELRLVNVALTALEANPEITKVLETVAVAMAARRY